MVISQCRIRLPKFSYLTYLKVNSEGEFLPELLNNSLHLETLHVQQGVDGHKKGNVGIYLIHVPSCFLSHLKEIEVDDFEGFEDEMQFVEYVLKNAKVLEKLTLHFPRTNGLEIDAKCLKIEAEWFKALLAFPRASSLCKVVVCQS